MCAWWKYCQARRSTSYPKGSIREKQNIPARSKGNSSSAVTHGKVNGLFVGGSSGSRPPNSKLHQGTGDASCGATPNSMRGGGTPATTSGCRTLFQARKMWLSRNSTRFTMAFLPLAHTSKDHSQSSTLEMVQRSSTNLLQIQSNIGATAEPCTPALPFFWTGFPPRSQCKQTRPTQTGLKGTKWIWNHLRASNTNKPDTVSSSLHLTTTPAPPGLSASTGWGSRPDPHLPPKRRTCILDWPGASQQVE